MNDQPIETLDQYRQALARHDWFFGYADDYTQYNQGQRNRDKMLAAAKTLDPDMTIWAEYRARAGAA